MTKPRTGFVALLAADAISTLGNRIAMVAIPWLVLVTTGSPAKMGLAAAAELVPYLLSGVFATPVSDRIGLRFASVTADTGSAVTVAAIAMLPGFPTLLGLIAVTGMLRGVGDRAKHVLLKPVTDDAGVSIARVTAAYESLARLAMLVGAPLGGLLIVWFGARGAMWADAVTFAACATLVGMLVRLRKEPKADDEPYLKALRGGARYLRQDHLLFLMISLIFVTNMFSSAETAVFLPVWSSDILHSPAVLGAVLGTFAAGGLIGSIVFTALVAKLPRYQTFLIGLFVSDFPVLLVLLSHSLPLVLAVCFVVGLAVSTVNPIIGAMQYERIPPELQNRVFGLVTAVCYAGLPIGGALGGWGVAALGLNPALVLAAAVCLAFILIFLVRVRGEWETDTPGNTRSSMKKPTYVLRALDAFAEFGDREAIVGVGWDCRLTYAQCRAMVLDMAAQLRDAGYKPGMTVAVMVAHPPEAPLLQLALHLLGCRTAWIAAGTSRAEVDEYIRQIGPEMFIYDPRTHPNLGTAVAKDLGLPIMCLGPDGLGPDLLSPSDAAPFDLDTAVGAPETIFQTSGTTGLPKPIHHMSGLYDQMYTLADQWVADGQPLLRHLSLTPMWYVAGQISAVLNLFTGGVLFILYEFEPAEYLATIEKHRANSVFISPLMFYELLDCPAIESTDCSSMELLSIGGAPLTPARLREGIARFGPVIRITYGLSETPWISAFPNINDDPSHPDRVRSCGQPYGDVRIQIRDEDGNVLKPGEVGELWVASRLNFAGYWGRPDLTEATMVDGWLRTHDLAVADKDGYLQLVGRAQDLIITGIGCDHIFPRPIEDALATHPQVRAAAVIGVPDPELGEAAYAYVIPTENATVTAEELSTVVAERLAEPWVPRTFEFVTELPRTSSGKVSTKELRARWAADHPAVGAMS
jgi:fatty-acyl-CoA synthase